VVDVANGTYDIVILLGDATNGHDQMGIYLEGTLVETRNTMASTWVTRHYRTSIADGQLTLTLDDLGGIDGNVVINALKIYGGPAGAPGVLRRATYRRRSRACKR